MRKKLREHSGCAILLYPSWKSSTFSNFAAQCWRDGKKAIVKAVNCILVDYAQALKALWLSDPMSGIIEISIFCVASSRLWGLSYHMSILFKTPFPSAPPQSDVRSRLQLLRSSQTVQSYGELVLQGFIRSFVVVEARAVPLFTTVDRMRRNGRAYSNESSRPWNLRNNIVFMGVMTM